MKENKVSHLSVYPQWGRSLVVRKLRACCPMRFFFSWMYLDKMVGFCVSQLLQCLHFSQCFINQSMSGLLGPESTFLLSTRHWPPSCIFYCQLLNTILPCLAFSSINHLLPNSREDSLVLPEKICHSLHTGCVGPAKVQQWNWCHFSGPSFPTKVSSLHPFWSSVIFDPPWESEIGLHVVCRLEVALFAALPRQSIREKEALSVPPSPSFDRLPRIPQDFLWFGISLPKKLMWFILGID